MSLSYRKAFVTVLALGTACTVGACSSASTDGNPGGTGGAGGDTATANCDSIDYASFSGGTVPSFQKDIMPIFGLSCTASDCHNSHDKKAGLDLGWRCNYVAATKTCEYPAAVDPNTTSSNPPKPLTPDVIKTSYDSLMAPATTIVAPSPPTPRVIPNNVEHSFIIEKVADTQAKQGYTCKNQDPSHTQNPLPCGDSMPLNSDALCKDTTRFGLLARWIANGALNN